MKNHIAATRTARGFSQEAMAARLGVTVPELDAWEEGSANPTPEIIVEMARLLNMPIDFLLARENEPGFLKGIE